MAVTGIPWFSIPGIIMCSFFHMYLYLYSLFIFQFLCVEAEPGVGGRAIPKRCKSYHILYSDTLYMSLLKNTLFLYNCTLTPHPLLVTNWSTVIYMIPYGVWEDYSLSNPSPFFSVFFPKRGSCRSGKWRTGPTRQYFEPRFMVYPNPCFVRALPKRTREY